MLESNDEENELLEQIIARPNQASKAGLLIVRLNRISKKPNIDGELSQVLSEYLKQLETSQIYLNDGIFNTNFSEGALLIQSAVALYSKKVDLLWDSVISYAERMVTYEEKTPENEGEFEKVEERKQRFKRKRKALPEMETEEKRTPLSVLQAYMDIKEEEDEQLVELLGRDKNSLKHKPKVIINNYNTPLSYYERTCQQLVKEKEPVHPKPLLKNTVNYFLREQLPNGDVETLCDIGRTSFFHISNGVDDVKMFKQLVLQKSLDEIEPYDFFEHVTNNFLLQNDKTIEDIYDNIELFYKEFELLSQKYIIKRGKKAKWRAIPKHMLLPVNDSDDESSDDEDDDSCDSGNGDDHLINLENGENNEKQTEESPSEVEIINNNASPSPRKTVDSRSDIDSGYFDKSGASIRHTPMTPFQLMSPEPEDSEKIKENEELSPMSPVQDEQTSNQLVGDYDSFKKSLRKRPSVASEISEDHNYCHQIKKKKIIERITSTPKKRAPRLRLLPITITSLGKFEQFFFNNYKPGVGEGELIEPTSFEMEADIDVDDMNITDNNFDNSLEEDTLNQTKDSLNTTVDDSGYQSKNQPTDDLSTPNLCSEETTTAENTIKPNENKTPESNEKASKKAKNKSNEPDEVDLRSQRYMEWRSFINSKIINQVENDFNIHEEGGKIIESIGEIDAKKNFKTICAGKSAESVSRTFIAMLQLANNSNVEILTQGFGVANDTMELKLLSKERHFEALNHYEAPSELDIRQKMRKFKVANSRKRLNEPSHGSSKSKMGKF